MPSTADTAAHSAEITLPIEIALDLFAAHLNRVMGPAHIVAASPALIEAGRLRLSEPFGQEPSNRFMRRMFLFPTAVQAPESARFDRLSTGGRVGVLIPGRLAPLIARLRRQPGAPPSLRFSDVARNEGLRSIERFSIGGPQSVFWAVLARAADQATRPDLRDRCAFRYRRALAPSRGQSASILIGLVLERP